MAELQPLQEHDEETVLFMGNVDFIGLESVNYNSIKHPKSNIT